MYNIGVGPNGIGIVAIYDVVPLRIAAVDFPRLYLPQYTLIVTIMGSKGIYSKISFKQWVDCSDPTFGLKVMII